MSLSLQAFLFVCFATASVYATGDPQEIIQPLLSYQSKCGNLYHNITFENERGCVGQYLYVSCSGMCGSYEIPKISHDRGTATLEPLQKTCRCCKAIGRPPQAFWKEVNVLLTCPDNTTEFIKRKLPELMRCGCVSCEAAT